MNSDEETPTISPPKLVPTTTTTTTTVKPPSTWLQRLYSSKGFQDSDHFLSNKIGPPTHQTIPTKNIPQKQINNNDNENGADLINNILSELFCMGDYENPTRIIKKKITRKQHCPRFYVVPKNPDAFEKVNVSVPQNPGVVGKVKVSVPQNPDAFGKVKVPVPLTLTGEKKVRVKVKVKVKRREVVEEEEEEEEEGEDWDVSGYSQTEVTVIDTSVSDWKFDRVLYRKKKTNVWKVGDTKGKGVLMNCGFGNKRKRGDNDNVNDVYKKKKLKFRNAEENDVEKKKKKKKKLILCNSLSYVDTDGGAPMVRMKSAQSSPPPHHFDHHNRFQLMSSPIRTIAQTSNWLPRLRASKGFPDTDDTDLEGFLSRLHKHVDRDLALTVTRPDLDKSADRAMRGFNDVFSELTEDTKRNLRNSDKISWSFPLTWTVRRRHTVKKVNRDLRMGLFPLSRTSKRKRTVREVNRERMSGERVKVEEKGDLDLSVSLKTEVTIIDTSNPSWISEKTLYRRKNVWEVGDKKGKSLMSGDKLITSKSLIRNGDGDMQKTLQLCSSSKSWAAAERGDIKKKKG